MNYASKRTDRRVLGTSRLEEMLFLWERKSEWGCPRIETELLSPGWFPSVWAAAAKNSRPAKYSQTQRRRAPPKTKWETLSVGEAHKKRERERDEKSTLWGHEGLRRVGKQKADCDGAKEREEKRPRGLWLRVEKGWLLSHFFCFTITSAAVSLCSIRYQPKRSFEVKGFLACLLWLVRNYFHLLWSNSRLSYKRFWVLACSTYKKSA